MIRTSTVMSLALLFAAAAHAGPLPLDDTQMDGVTAGQSAKNPYYAITGDTTTPQSQTASGGHPVFKPTGWGSVGHSSVPALRFGSGGAIAIPGNAGNNANANSAFTGYSNGTAIIRPPGHNR